MGFEQKGISKVASGLKVFDDVQEIALEVFLTQPLPLEEQVEGLEMDGNVLLVGAFFQITDPYNADIIQC